ncbi:hypothetical protein AB0I51_05545 [Streptomyces sp. NPDC050549]|uniref:hypothetical protein n=1 Tax=Streptomyces sp. NPDC050549 TaxID=3155406 RepID=UPI003430B45F
MTGILTFAAVVAAPFALALAHDLIAQISTDTLSRRYFWLAYFSFVDVLCVWSQWVSCHMFHSLTPDLDDMLSARGKGAVHGWLDAKTSAVAQGTVMMSGAGSAAFLVYIASRSPKMTQLLSIDLASYVSAAITGACVFNCMYWLAQGAHFARVVTRPGYLELSWISPANTPGVELLVRCYRMGSLLAAVGSAACIFPWVYWMNHAEPTILLRIAKWFLVVLSAGVLIPISFVPQWRLSMAVSEYRISVIRRISRELPVHPPTQGSQLTNDLALRVDILEKVSSSPSGVIDKQSVAGALLALATALIPTLGQLMLR